MGSEQYKNHIDFDENIGKSILPMVVILWRNYQRTCAQYEDFLFRGSIMVSMLLKQGYSSEIL